MIRFTDAQWETVRANYRKWWKGELGRPILPLVISGADPQREKPKNELLQFANVADFSITPEQIIDRYDYELSCYEYYGDSFPEMHMEAFGAGLSAAFLGAQLHNTRETVWFHPERVIPIEELHLEYDADNLWLRRIKDIYRAGMARWHGDVVMGMIDLGGVIDVLATFVTTEELCLALYDQPEEVERLVGEIAVLWRQFYAEIIDIIGTQQGFSDWSSIFSEKPSYMLQSDFSYMISNEMFRRFVAPELDETARGLVNPFYHLDGIGQLVHVDTLLGMESIQGIQWVPGDGEPLSRDWSELYARISAAGKKIQAYYDFDSYFDEILAVIRRPDDLVKMQFGYPAERKEEALRRLGEFL